MLMSALIKPGRIIFALGIIALGILQFFAKDYVVARPPSPEWSADIPGKTIWAYISGCILIIPGLFIIFRIKAKWAALFIGFFILVCSFFLRHLPEMTKANWEGILWSINAYKALVFFGGALLVVASFNKEEGYSFSETFSNSVLITTGIVCLSFFLIVCGAAHFKFSEFVFTLIPDCIPAHVFWTYFAAVALLAGGVGIIFRATRKWAAALSGLMILLWFVLLHIPRALATPGDYGEWMGVCESFSFGGILFVLAGLSMKKNVRKTESHNISKASITDKEVNFN
jgi:uncharacterized membrane protein